MKNLTLIIVFTLLSGLIHVKSIHAMSLNQQLKNLGITSKEQTNISQQMYNSSNQIFTADERTYEQQAYVKASNTGEFDRFGTAIALSGDTLVVGAFSEDSDGSGQDNESLSGSGAAYVFVRVDETWQQQAYLKAENPGMFDVFGKSVAISGDTIVVGASQEGGDASSAVGSYNDNAPNAGAAYVFTRSGITWTQQAYLKADNAESTDFFGGSVGVSGDTVVVGALFEDSSSTEINVGELLNDAEDSGAVYVFSRIGTTWSQQAYLKASNTQAVDEFGTSVSVSYNSIVVGAFGEDGDDSGQLDESGAAYVFVRDGSTWTQQALLKADNAGAGDEFGLSVSISGNTIAVGSPAEKSTTAGIDFDDNNSGDRNGAAYIFQRNGILWSQQARIKPDIIDEVDAFGISIALSGESLVVGALGEDSNATGVNQNAVNNDLQESGAAYVFARSNGVWQQHSYLKASNSNNNWRTGGSVTIYGDLVATGASFENNNATGVNGNENNGIALDSGAVYVFYDSSLTKRFFDVNSAIPDNDVNGLTIPLDMSGHFSGDIIDFEIAINLIHTWVGDLEVVLNAPDGIARLVLFARSGMRKSSLGNFGAGSNLNGRYAFNDLAGEDFWASAISNDETGFELIPPNRYRSSTPGNNISGFGGCSTRLNGSFSGLTSAQTNGEWTLTIKDLSGSDTGFVKDVEIITRQASPIPVSDVIFSSDFEFYINSVPFTYLSVASPIVGNCQKAQFDYTGTGLSDYVTTYETEKSPDVTTVNF